jgi:HD-GYP domain-containing protein (c-di-GMP phosphodiesterase class II)
MRFVPIPCLKENMILGKNLYGNNNQLLLREGQPITRSYIKKFEEIGLQGIYIKDNISQDIEVKDIIHNGLRRKIIQRTKDLFLYAKRNNDKQAFDALNQSEKMVEKIVEDIIGNRNLIVNMIDLKTFDDYTFQHSVNVAILSLIIGVAVNMDRERLYKLGLGALLHDIGKVFVDKTILNKEGKLTDSEYKKIKEHPLSGYQYLKSKFTIPALSYIAVLDHHERYDGTGYPNGKTGDHISVFGRIIAIADVYDALISNRPYRRGLLPSEAVEYIMGGSGTLFDPNFATVFSRYVAAYPVGMCVKLSDERIAIVVENFKGFSTRPKVRIIDTGEILELRNINNITITGIAEI